MTKYRKSLFNVSPHQLYDLLEEKYQQFNTLKFIENDPIQIPHRFSKKQDIEISAFWTCVLAWGNRKSIIQSAGKLMEWMHHAPHDFVVHCTERDLKPFLQFKHRTFNATDTLYFLEFFKHHYLKHSSLEDAFFTQPAQTKPAAANMENRLMNFYNYFFSLDGVPDRTRKHVATPAKKSTCKRLNMFLRWMVRSDPQKVDFGIWKKIKPSELLCPLDVHVENAARYLGLIQRKQRDWQTVLELTENLKCFDPNDPVKYDFALFGISASLSNKLGILDDKTPAR